MIEESYSEPISVVVPLYNKVNEVCRAIDSVFSQTVQDFELIIVDGGSTDGSFEAIQKYIDDERFTLIHQKSKGVASGRNEGIVASKYDMIAFLDADEGLGFWVWCHGSDEGESLCIKMVGFHVT